MMETKRAVLFVDDAEGELIRKPLMLQNVLFCPVLTWLSTALREQGVERFFVCCPASYQEEALACFSSAEQVTVSDNRADLLAFLEGEEETLVVPGAAVPVDSAGQNEVYRASGSVLAHSLETGAEEVEGARSVPGFTSSGNCLTAASASWIPTILMWIRVFAWARVRCCCPARSCGAGL